MTAPTTGESAIEPVEPDVAVNDDGVQVRVAPPPAGPNKSDRYRRKIHLVASVRELWNSREMVRSVAERELRARYKQTYLGYAWALVTPFSFMIAFALFFTRVAEVD